MRKPIPKSVAVWVATALVAACAALWSSQRARAEFKVGDSLPDFSLKIAEDDSAFSFARRPQQVLVTQGKKQLTPQVVVLHLFQPDCLQCQAQLKVLEGIHQEYAKQGVLVVGVSHRGDANAVRLLAKQLKVTFPLATGTGSELAKQFAAGDSFAIIDRNGVVGFAEAGYGQGDEKIWRENIELLLAGQSVKQEGIARQRLQVGDRLPVIALDSVVTGKAIALTGEGGKLTFRDETGKVSHPKAAIGLFSRY